MLVHPNPYGISKGLAKLERVGCSCACGMSKGLAKLEGVGYSCPSCMSKGLAKSEGVGYSRPCMSEGWLNWREPWVEIWRF